MAVIVALADHRTLVDTLAEWFEAEWPEYYATQPSGTARRDFLDPEQTWLVAIADGQPAGCVALRREVIGGVGGFSPAIGGLLVHPSRRGRGLGSRLVEAASAQALASGAPAVFLSTLPARRLVERLGWREIATVKIGGEEHPIFRLNA